MKRSIFIVSLLLLCASFLGAQNFAFSSYLSLKDPYKFNLPFQKISISMPAFMGFKYAKIPDQKGFLAMDDDVNFFVPDDALVTKETVRFSAKSNDTSYMSLYVNHLEKFFSNTYLENKRASSKDFEIIPSIQNNLGKSTAYACNVNGKMMDFHVYYLDGILYQFVMPSNQENKDVYESAIKSIKKKAFKKEILQYEERQKARYLEAEEKKADLEATANDPELTQLTGATKQNFTFNFEQDKLTMDIPKDYVYDINARKLSWNDNQIVDIYRAESDTKESFFISRFSGPQGSFMYRTAFNKKDQDAEIALTLETYKSIYNNVDITDIVIDGIKGKAIYYGAPSCPSAEVFFEKNGIYYSFSLFNITEKNINGFDKIFSSIKIEGDGRRIAKYYVDSPISSIIKVEPMPKVAIEDLIYSKKSTLESFSCRLETMGMTLILPGNPSEYTYGLDTNWGEDVLQLGKNNQTDLAPSPDAYFVAIRSKGQQCSADLTLYMNYGIPFSAEDVATEIKIGENQVKSRQPYKTIGIVTAKDKSKWVVAIEESGTKALILGGNKDYNIYYTLEAQSSETVDALLGLINNFAIDK